MPWQEPNKSSRERGSGTFLEARWNIDRSVHAARAFGLDEHPLGSLPARTRTLLVHGHRIRQADALDRFFDAHPALPALSRRTIVRTDRLPCLRTFPPGAGWRTHLWKHDQRRPFLVHLRGIQSAALGIRQVHHSLGAGQTVLQRIFQRRHECAQPLDGLCTDRAAHPSYPSSARSGFCIGFLCLSLRTLPGRNVADRPPRADRHRHSLRSDAAAG